MNEPSEFAWVAYIQEEIREARSNRRAFMWLTVAGVLFALFPVFVYLILWAIANMGDKTLSGNPLSSLVWSIPVGLVIIIGGFIGAFVYDGKIKKLIQELKQKKVE